MDIRTPSRMARHMAADSARPAEPYKRHVFLSFHSDSGRGRGVHALVNRNTVDELTGQVVDSGWHTKNQEDWAKLASARIRDDLVSLTANGAHSIHGFSRPWDGRRRLVSEFTGVRLPSGKIRGNRKSEITDAGSHESGFRGTMDATIVETGFHDHPIDAALLVDPKVRDAIGRATARAVVDYFRAFDPDADLPETLAPERPWAPEFRITGTRVARLSWRPPSVAAGAGGDPIRYVVYLSRDGRSFFEAKQTADSAIDLDRELVDGKALYARITALNDAGESMPSPVVGVRWRSDHLPILVVLGHEELVAENNPTQLAMTTGLHVAPTFIYWVDPEGNNSLDYVVDVSECADLAFDSCWSNAVAEIDLTEYRGIIWCCGREGRRGPILSPAEQSRLETYCREGGKLLIHGGRLASWIDLGSGESRFLSEVLGAQLHRLLWRTRRVIVAAQGPLGETLDADLVLRFDTSLGSPYKLWNHDGLNVDDETRRGARFSNTRDDGESTAIVVNEVGAGRVVYMAFPFEALETSDGQAGRRKLLAVCLEWLGLA
jgi:hypothetical protein